MQCLNAAVLTGINKQLKIKKLKSRTLERGQVLVKILYSGVCRSQLMEIKGLRGEDRWLPHLLGHEGSGIVEDVGDGVTKVKEGDEVILTWIRCNGLEAVGAKYDCLEDNTIINSGCVTTFSNFSVVSENRLIKKPPPLSFKDSILFGCALPTGAGMVLNEITSSKTSSVIILGLGGVGLSAIAALLSQGMEEILAIDISNEKLGLVSSWGVKHTLNASDSDLALKVKKLYKDGSDFCLESAGKVSTIELGFSLINKNSGKLIFASHPPEGDMIKINPYELISGKKLKGTWGGSVKPDKDIPKIFKILSSSGFPLGDLLSEPYSLQEINTAIKDLERGKTLRPLIKMEH